MVCAEDGRRGRVDNLHRAAVVDRHHHLVGLPAQSRNAGGGQLPLHQVGGMAVSRVAGQARSMGRQRGDGVPDALLVAIGKADSGENDEEDHQGGGGAGRRHIQKIELPTTPAM